MAAAALTGGGPWLGQFIIRGNGSAKGLQENRGQGGSKYLRTSTGRLEGMGTGLLPAATSVRLEQVTAH